MYIYICILILHIHIPIYIYTYMFAYTYTHTHAYLHVNIYVCVYTPFHSIECVCIHDICMHTEEEEAQKAWSSSDQQGSIPAIARNYWNFQKRGVRDVCAGSSDPRTSGTSTFKDCVGVCVGVLCAFVCRYACTPVLTLKHTRLHTFTHTRIHMYKSAVHLILCRCLFSLSGGSILTI